LGHIAKSFEGSSDVFGIKAEKQNIPTPREARDEQKPKSFEFGRLRLI
jgi:hypothetical protein